MQICSMVAVAECNVVEMMVYGFNGHMGGVVVQQAQYSVFSVAWVWWTKWWIKQSPAPAFSRSRWLNQLTPLGHRG